MEHWNQCFRYAIIEFIMNLILSSNAYFFLFLPVDRQSRRKARATRAAAQGGNFLGLI